MKFLDILKVEHIQYLEKEKTTIYVCEELCIDKDSKKGDLIINRTVTMRDKKK